MTSRSPTFSPDELSFTHVLTAQMASPHLLIRTVARPSPRCQVPAMASGEASAAAEKPNPTTQAVTDASRMTLSRFPTIDLSKPTGGRRPWICLRPKNGPAGPLRDPLERPGAQL